jgi:hypothetical protein
MYWKFIICGRLSSVISGDRYNNPNDISNTRMRKNATSPQMSQVAKTLRTPTLRELANPKRHRFPENVAATLRPKY